MKFSKSTYPILDVIEKKDLNRLDLSKNFCEEILNNTKSEDLSRFSQQASTFLKTFNRHNYKISYFASTVFEKVQSVFKKLETLRKELPNCRGLFLLPDETILFYEYTEKKLTILHGWENQFMGYGTLHFDIDALPTGEDLKIDMIPRPQIIDNNLYFGENYGDNLIFNTALGYILFYHLVELELVVISESKTFKRKATIDNVEYTTQSSLKIEIVDSTWFRTICRTEGFGVNGHFRLQPVGEGLSKRKLIWIDEYQKHGYNIRAKLDKLNEEIKGD